MTEKNKALLAILGPLLLVLCSKPKAIGSIASAVGRFGSFKKSLPQTQRIQKLLQHSQKTFEKDGNVDEIVGSFAMAQELIHSDEFKSDYEINPEKQAIVEQFADLGMALSE